MNFLLGHQISEMSHISDDPYFTYIGCAVSAMHLSQYSKLDMLVIDFRLISMWPHWTLQGSQRLFWHMIKNVLLCVLINQHICIFYEIADRLNHRRLEADICSSLNQECMNHNRFEAKYKSNDVFQCPNDQYPNDISSCRFVRTVSYIFLF